MGWAARARQQQESPRTRTRVSRRGPSRWLRNTPATHPNPRAYRLDALGRSIEDGSLIWVPTMEWDLQAKQLVHSGAALRRRHPKARGKQARRAEKRDRQLARAGGATNVRRVTFR